MRDLLFRPAARDDPANLYRFIADRSGSPEQAIAYIRRIRAACERLRAFPELGRRRDDIHPGLRLIGFERRVVIGYKLLPSGAIEIGRVLYGGRDHETLVAREEGP
ncbi:MAG: type II toxin-antitoxin system RelE/ParE family toxin [Reyranellaceae bacterium]